MGGLLHLAQRGGAWAGPSLAIGIIIMTVNFDWWSVVGLTMCVVSFLRYYKNYTCICNPRTFSSGRPTESEALAVIRWAAW